MTRKSNRDILKETNRKSGEKMEPYYHEPLVAGVPPGGYRDIPEIRILICYLLNAIKEPLSRSNLNYIFQTNHLVNYFSFVQALSELMESQHIEVTSKNGEEYYTLNKVGKEAAEVLKSSLPRTVRDTVVSSATNLLTQLKLERENEVTITPYQNGYNVKFILHDTDVDLMKFRLFVPDKAQAERVKQNFLKNPALFYSQIINLLTSEN